jgi:hypothetical protein
MAWLQLKFPESIMITKIKLYITFNTSHVSFAKIQGSNDGETWTDLRNVENYTGYQDIALTSTMFAQYYRIYSEFDSGYDISVSDWQVTGWEKATGNPIYVETFTNPYIDINGLGKRQILGTIKHGKYYNLVYDGAVWHAVATTHGVDTTPIVITSSGTYTVDSDLTYKVIAKGGGGGAAYVYSTYADVYVGVAGGGAGGMIEDTFKPSSDNISVTIGAAGSNRNKNSSASASIQGTSGGSTIIGNFVAGGGGYGYVSYVRDGDDVVTQGTGGSYSGGNGTNGASGTKKYTTDIYGKTQEIVGQGGAGMNYDGGTYGRGGTYAMDDSQEELTQTQSATSGIVILYPMV